MGVSPQGHLQTREAVPEAGPRTRSLRLEIPGETDGFMRRIFQSHRQGFTIVELLVVISTIALLIAILLPAIGKARDAAKVTQSSANLRNLAVANDTYASDWADRQFTAVPDDIGYTNGDASAYNREVACMPQQLLGYDNNGRIWGWWCAEGALCDSFFGGPTPPDCTFDYAYTPMSYKSAPGSVFGS